MRFILAIANLTLCTWAVFETAGALRISLIVYLALTALTMAHVIGKAAR